MSNKKTIKELILLFERLKEDDPKCDRMLCSTCGGYGVLIKNQLSHDVLHTINSLLENISPSEFKEFGVWATLLNIINHYGVHSVYKREAQSLDLSDIRAVDSFLFEKRSSYLSSSYEKDYLLVLEYAVSIAVKTIDVSLVETLVIIIKEKLDQYPDLLSIAITISKNNDEIQRVLYNYLRESVPAVRGYVGAGITVHPSVQPWY